jgi:hypothetical protein
MGFLKTAKIFDICDYRKKQEIQHQIKEILEFVKSFDNKTQATKFYSNVSLILDILCCLNNTCCIKNYDKIMYYQLRIYFNDYISTSIHEMILRNKILNLIIFTEMNVNISDKFDMNEKIRTMLESSLFCRILQKFL